MNKRILSFVLALIVFATLSSGVLHAGATTITTATNVDAVPTEENLLAGLTPVKPDGTAYPTMVDSEQPVTALTDGVMDTNTAHRWKGNAASGGRVLVYDLQATATITKFLVGSVDPRYITGVDIYVGDSLTDLCATDNLAVSVSSVGTYHNTFSAEGVSFSGRFVAFDFTKTEMAWLSNQLRLSELGVYGVREIVWVPHYITTAASVSAVPERDNLLANRPLKDSDGNDFLTMSDSEQPDTVLTDGVLGTNDTVADTRWRGNAAQSGLILVYDMGATAAIDTFLIGSADTRFVTMAKIYVGDSRDELFDEENLAVSVPSITTLHNVFVAEGDRLYTGRYIAFDFTGIDIPAYLANQLRLSELGAYGSYTDGPPPTNLLLGKLPVERCEIPARGIDNQTAVDAAGNLGSGNTGAFTDRQDIYLMDGAVENITDGDYTTQANHHTRSAPSTGRSDTVDYDTPWIVLAYHLGGETKLSEVVLSSLPAYYYRIAGVQYYASYNWADLFKNESLLYTSGGEYYVEAANSTPEIPIYLPDSSKDVNVQQHLNYALTDQQKAATYRYVAVVITRPHSRFVRDTENTQVLKGWAQARIGDFAAYGNIVGEELPLANAYTQYTVIGEVTMEVQYFNYDDRTFFEDTLAGFTVTAEPLPSDAQTATNANWLSVDGDTVYRVELVDKNGKVIPATHEDPSKGLNGREVQFTFPSTAEYVQTMGVLSGNSLTRVYNAFSDINNGRRIRVGALNYPTYAESVISNRDKATLCGTQFRFVYMKANDIHTANTLSGRRVNQTLEEFTATEAVEGVQASHTVWWFVPLTVVVGVAVLLFIRHACRGKGGAR